MLLTEIANEWVDAPVLIRLIAKKYDAGVPIYYSKQVTPGVGRPLMYSLQGIGRLREPDGSDARTSMSFSTPRGSITMLILLDEFVNGPTVDGSNWTLEPSVAPYEGGFEIKKVKE